MVTDMENSDYDKNFYYKKKNKLKKYSKFCKEDKCTKYAYYNYEDRKNKLYCKEHKKDNMTNKIIKKDNKCKYLNCKKFTKTDFCNRHRYKCLSCDTRIK